MKTTNINVNIIIKLFVISKNIAEQLIFSCLVNIFLNDEHIKAFQNLAGKKQLMYWRETTL